MALLASKPSKSLLLLVSIATLLLLSTIKCYDGHHTTVVHLAIVCYSRLGSQHMHQRQTATSHWYMLTEKSNSTGGGVAHNNHTSLATSNLTAPSTASTTQQGHHQHSHKQRVRNWIIGFMVRSLVIVISGLLLLVLFWLVLNCIHRRY